MKKNVNCLAGMRCPHCGATEPLKIMVTQTMMANFSDEGSYGDAGGDMEWGENSACECGECGHSGTVTDFSKNLDNDDFVDKVMTFHDLSEEFWDSLDLNQQQELSNEMVKQQAAMPSLKYYVGKIVERNGEREYTERVCFSTLADPAIILNDAASQWCGIPDSDPDEYRHVGYYFGGGCYFVKADGSQEVSKEEFDILGRFLTIL